MFTAPRRRVGHVFADEIVVGLFVIPPDATRPVEIIAQMSDPGHADYFEFACRSGNGYRALRLHRSQQVEVISR